MARAAEAALKHPGRTGRSLSPSPVDSHGKVVEVVEETVVVGPTYENIAAGAEELVAVIKRHKVEVATETLATEVLGEEAMVVETKVVRDGFEWPEDVF